MANRNPGSVSQARPMGRAGSNDNQEAAANLALQGIEYGKRAAFNVNDADKELWGIVADVPRLHGVWPYICAILNVVLPGSGTMLASCVADTQSWSKTQIFVGILQMLLQKRIQNL